MFPFFWGELSYTDDIDIHCIRIFGLEELEVKG